jgi:glycosyltransferase involved in cell wall biosynthesis
VRIVYAITYWGMTGGVKVLAQHVKLLNDRGHDARLITRIVEERWEAPFPPTIVPSFADRDIPPADVIVVTSPRDVEALWPVARDRGVPLVHFLQGFEPDYILERITGSVVPEKFKAGGLLAKLRYRYKISEWKRKLDRLDRLYRLPTIKAAISPHLVAAVQNRYQVPCRFLPNGIDLAVFRAKEPQPDYAGSISILSVGNSNIEYKAIPDVLEAVRILRERGMDIVLTRVSPAPIPDGERLRGIADRFFVRIPELQIAGLYRESHVLIAASTEIEGFGLPPVEAMASGTPVILTKVSPFLAFDEPHDYAHFVDVHRPDLIADGVQRIVRDPKLRGGLIRRGLEVAQKYSLERLGRRLDELLIECKRKDNHTEGILNDQ